MANVHLLSYLSQNLLPITADQSDTAALCASHGVAVTLAPDERSASSLGSALDTVLADPVMRHRAEAWQRAVERLPGPADVARSIE